MGFTNFPFGITSFGVPVFGDFGIFGPATGELYYKVTSRTDGYYSLLHKRGVKDGKIFTDLATAHAAMTADQGDTLIIMPGLHTETATCDWTKDRTNLIGVGSPNILDRVGRPNTMLYTDTAGVDYVIHLTGDNCQFVNISIQNGASGGSATTTNLSAVGIAGYGNYFANVQFRGINTANQIATAGCSSLEITTGAGELLFENCIIGQNGWGGQRTNTTQGHLLFTAGVTTPSPQNGVFKNCLFLNRTNTAGCPMVYESTLWGGDRLWLFENCFFENWVDNHNYISTEVFKTILNSQQWNVRLRNCGASGYTYWTTCNIGTANSSNFMADMPITATGGGLMIACNGIAGV